MLRGRLDEVRQKVKKYRKARGSKKEDIQFSAEDMVLRNLLSRKIRLRAHVHKIDDIAALLRLVDEFKIHVTVDHAGDVHRPEIFQELKKRKIPVVYGPIDSFAYKVELKHEDRRKKANGHLLFAGTGILLIWPVIRWRCTAKGSFSMLRRQVHRFRGYRLLVAADLLLVTIYWPIARGQPPKR